MTSPKALIFDIDGTLWDSVALVGEGYNLQLIDDGHPELCISEAKLRTLFGKTMVELADVCPRSSAWSRWSGAWTGRWSICGSLPATLAIRK